VVNSHSYLGVTVSSDLRWHKHVTMYQPRLPKLSTSYVAMCIVVPDTKATAYISLVRPHPEYAAAAWDPYLVGDCKM